MAAMLGSVSTQFSRSCSLTGIPLSSETRTVSRLLPRLETSLVMELVALSTRLTSTTSAITPMMMPSIVSAARILFAPMLRSAIFTAIIRATPP